MSGIHGSKIVVTTRSENVALIMGTVPSHRLRQLTDEDCWLLFAKHAFNNVESREQPILEEMGREIVKKCKGLALAAKILGGLLRSKLDPDDWNKILTSEIWDSSEETHNILPALRLSYDHLPSHLKQCFSFVQYSPKIMSLEGRNWSCCGWLQIFYNNPDKRRGWKKWEKSISMI